MPEKPDPQETLLPLNKLKSLVRHAETAPVNCALGLTKDRTALLLLDKIAKPKALAARLKTEAEAALTPTSLRFGRIGIDASVPQTVKFTVNKNEAGGTITAMLRLIRKTGYQDVVFNPDPALENEKDDADPPLQSASPPEPPPPPPAPPPPAAGAEASDDTALTRELAALIKRIPAAAAGDTATQQRLLALATTARDHLKAGDLPSAVREVAALKASTNNAAAAKPLGPSGANGSAVALTKCILLWDATRKDLENQLKPLEQEIVERCAGQSGFEHVAGTAPTVLRGVLEKLDGRLSDKLNQMHQTEDQAARQKLRQEAKSVVGFYQSYIAAEPLIAALDSNPFIKFDGVARVRSALQAITAYL
jgi:hypothetical protein